MNELQQLEAKIRQALPRLQELSKGCIFYIKNMPFYYEFLYFVYDDDEQITEIATLYNGEIDVFEYEYFLNQDVTIIGHEIYLSDVLEWLKDANFYYTYDLQTIQRWDLPKPLLKDQPKEVIEYLNNLVSLQ